MIKSITRQKERSFYGHMRNNQNLTNRQTDSNNINGIHLHHQSITILEPVTHIDHNHGIDTSTDPTAKITQTIKDLEITIEVTTIEASAIIEINITEAEITAITEIIIIITDIKTDLTPNLQIEITQDTIHHIIEIMKTITLTIDKDKIPETQLKIPETDRDPTVTIMDINQKITTEIVDEIHQTVNNTIDIIQETETIIEIKIIVTTE